MQTITPGTYLRLRREAAGLSIEDLALRIETWPRTCARYRADLIETIEQDATPISPGTAVALSKAFRFDPMVLDQLAAIHAGSMVSPPQICRGCGCSWHDPCLPGAPIGRCVWSKDDATLCTECEKKPELIAVRPSAQVINLAVARITESRL